MIKKNLLVSPVRLAVLASVMLLPAALPASSAFQCSAVAGKMKRYFISYFFRFLFLPYI
jgi:hypothetical protein